MNLRAKLFHRRSTRGEKARRSPVKLGLSFVAATLLLGALLFNKDAISTALRPGDTIQIHFDRNFKLRPYVSEVKIAFVPVGVVSGIERLDDGSAVVSAKVDSDVGEKLRSSPIATIRPTTLLGGNYFIDLKPGGAPATFDGSIPRGRTHLPVELDRITGALQPQALDGMRGGVRQLDGSLGPEGRNAIHRLLESAPRALPPTGRVLRSVRGNHPDTDLPNLVHGLESASTVLSTRQGQLESIVDNLRVNSGVLADVSAPLSETLADLPDTLRTADTGLDRLHTTLGKLRDTSQAARPVAAALDTTLRHLNPVLARAEPFTRDLRKTLINTRPLIEQLVPTSQRADTVLSDLRGPVLDRLNGPVRKFLLSPYKGEREYANSNSRVPMYKEVAGMATNLDKTASYVDGLGSALSIQIGFGTGTAAGLPVSPEHLLDQLTQRLRNAGRGGR